MRCAAGEESQKNENFSLDSIHIFETENRFFIGFTVTIFKKKTLTAGGKRRKKK